MTSKNFKLLGMVVAALVLAVLLLNSNQHDGSASYGRPLLPEFAGKANDAQLISVVTGDSDPIILRRESGQWVVGNRDNYPADIGKLRQIIVALASAKILEEKTSNPDLYKRLDIDDPQKGGSGTGITIDGDGFSFSLIVGKQVQGDHRYVRVAGTEQGYLIDQNPKIPQGMGGWLLPDIMDIAAKRVRKATIKHKNGQTITVEKSAEELSDFSVLDVPKGRELSYATVGNGIAGVLSNLGLEDVRAATDESPVSSAVFQTWDGLRITVAISKDDQSTWLAFVADAPVEGVTDEADDIAHADADTTALGDEVTRLNEHLSGWQFKVSDYKKDLLTKRWESILKPLESSSK